MTTILRIASQEVIIDGSDYSLVSSIASWYIDGHGYAYTLMADGSRLFMHRLLCPQGEVVDHINQVRLDNRRSNLRPATRSQNAINRGKTKASKTGYKGVFKVKSGKFVAAIRANYTLYHIGTYKTAEEAAVVYDNRAFQYFGEFAVFNFPREQ